jgi:hypothetical protein
MSHEFEDFVRKNRDAFDDKEPSGRIWKRIEGELFPVEKKSIWNSVTVWRAAAMIFMALSVYLMVPKNTVTHTNQTTASLSEFTDVEEFYIGQISQKTELIEEFQRNEGLNGFTHDFQQLEAMYMVLKEEMKTRPSQKVKDALVLNLLVRIDLLNQQLHKLEKGEYKDEQENQPVEEKKKRSV